VPNSRLTAENVVNWSQNKKTTRFKIDVGVAYGSDTRLVQKILIEAAMKSQEVLNKPEPTVIFSDFGESSLNFSLLFFSKNLFRIERTKSDIRFEIDRLFRENKISIPFPQRDIWFKNQAPDSSL
jgi:small-conductance mechanosensitive channel